MRLGGFFCPREEYFSYLCSWRSVSERRLRIGAQGCPRLPPFSRSFREHVLSTYCAPGVCRAVGRQWPGCSEMLTGWCRRAGPQGQLPPQGLRKLGPGGGLEREGRAWGTHLGRLHWLRSALGLSVLKEKVGQQCTRGCLPGSSSTLSFPSQHLALGTRGHRDVLLGRPALTCSSPVS